MPIADQPPPDGADQRTAPPGDTAARARPASAAGTQPTLARGDRLDSQDELWHRNRRLLLRLLIAFALASPFLSAHRPEQARLWFLGSATAVSIKRPPFE